MTSPGRTWQDTPRQNQPHRTRVHPKPPALIRHRASTSLVSTTSRSTTQPVLPGLLTPQLALTERNATRRTRPWQAQLIPHLPRRSGTVPARVWFPKQNPCHLTPTCLASPDLNTSHHGRVDRPPCQHDGGFHDLTGTASACPDITRSALTHPTMQHRSCSHADRVGGFFDATQLTSTDPAANQLDTPRPTMIHPTLHRRRCCRAYHESGFQIPPRLARTGRAATEHAPT